MPLKSINLRGYGNIQISDSAGKIISFIERDPSNPEYNAAIDGMEALILALLVNGVDVTSLEFSLAIQSALDAINNNFGD